MEEIVISFSEDEAERIGALLRRTVTHDAFDSDDEAELFSDLLNAIDNADTILIEG